MCREIERERESVCREMERYSVQRDREIVCREIERYRECVRRWRERDKERVCV